MVVIEEMEKNKELYMSDVEYVKILERIVETVKQPGFEPKFYDDTTNCAKRTWSNCGLCNDDENSTFATKENVAFPDQFPHRRDFKYFETHQQCPLDWRKNPDINGCFHTCYLFGNKESSISVDSIRSMVMRRLNEKKGVTVP